jgi:hypothetical protein
MCVLYTFAVSRIAGRGYLRRSLCFGLAFSHAEGLYLALAGRRASAEVSVAATAIAPRQNNCAGATLPQRRLRTEKPRILLQHHCHTYYTVGGQWR